MPTTSLWLASWSIGLTILVACGQPASSPAPGRTETTSSLVASVEEEAFAARRQRMVKEDIEGRGIEDARVLAAMRTVPRHQFVPAQYRKRAYDDNPLPIGEGQTISQPYTVALMSELLGVGPGDKVLEVGTGSAYQAVVLAEMGAEVYSIEIIAALAERANTDLERLGYGGIRLRAGDGYFGWEEEAPFDAIMVTAAPDHIPAPLLGQLKPTGRMVVPVGPPGSIQTLWLVEKKDGRWVSVNQGPVRFVTLVGDGSP